MQQNKASTIERPVLKFEFGLTGARRCNQLIFDMASSTRSATSSQAPGFDEGRRMKSGLGLRVAMSSAQVASAFSKFRVAHDEFAQRVRRRIQGSTRTTGPRSFDGGVHIVAQCFSCSIEPKRDLLGPLLKRRPSTFALRRSQLRKRQHVQDKQPQDAGHARFSNV